MNSIINGAPMVNAQGVNDKSTRTLAVEPEAIPTHLPKVLLFTQKGRPGPQLVVGTGRDALFGTDTFDIRKPYATHQTILSNLVNAEGNAQMIERVIPEDAGPKANFLLSIDILETTVPLYQRSASGALILGPDGLPQQVTGQNNTIPGLKIKWAVTSVETKQPSDTDSDLFGVALQGPGDQTDGQTQSTRYPILEFWADSEGSFFNNAGFRIWAPNTNSNGGINTAIMGTRKVYPFRMAAITRKEVNSTANLKETIQGETYFDFTLAENIINPATDAQFSLEDIYLGKYQSTADKRFTPQYADFSNMRVYRDNLEEVLGILMAAEEDYLTEAGSDFSATTVASLDEQKYLYNLFTLTSSTGVPYRSAILVSGANSIRLTEGTNIWAKGGSDGTMTLDVFNDLVGARLAEYANPNSNLMDSAINVESIFYDTGFPLEVKYEAAKFISQRKDLAVVLSTYEVGGQNLSISEEHSLAVSLRTRLQMYPESDYFGTATMRGVIVGRAGTLRSSNYKGKLPLTLELAVKAARFMGAGNGKWDPVALFDKAPNNQITLFDLDDYKYVPAQQRNLDWDVGLNYPQSYSRSALYFPALKTVYNDDTSVLNSFFTMMACVELQKVGERVHRDFSGAINFTNAQLIERVNRKVEEYTQGRFADLFQIKPAAYISNADDLRGYSWTLPIKLYANNMKTVMSLSIESYRMSDYTE